MQFSSYDTGSFYDEMFEEGALPSPQAQLLLETITSLSAGQLLRYEHAVERMLLQLGITVDVYRDFSDYMHPWTEVYLPRGGWRRFTRAGGGAISCCGSGSRESSPHNTDTRHVHGSSTIQH